jgi:hypothetical protein
VSAEDRSGRPQYWSTRVVDLLEWPRGIARLAAASCAAVAIAVLVYEVPRTVDSLGDTAARNASLSFADRDVAGGNAVLADQQLAYQARSIIPSDASYWLVTGPKLTKQAALPISSLPGFLRYFLMPRRSVDGSSWIVCYGCLTSQWGNRYEVLWQDDYGISVGRLEN